MPTHPSKSKSKSKSSRPIAARHLILAAILLAGSPPLRATAQAPPPDGDWLTFRTEHFRVTYPPALEPLARQAADVAERTYVVLRDELGEPPSGTIELVVTDHVDFTNGYANAFPSSRIVVYAMPPTGTPQLAYSRDWIELVVVHELVHIFHLDESGRVGNIVRALFGRLPMLWPVFPVIGSPTWNVEGLATHYESRLTGAGRVRGSFHDMMVRTAALEDRIPDLDDVSAPRPAWPGGQRSYGYGSRLMDHIADRYGPDAHRAIVEATGGSLRPTFLLFDHVSRRAVGKPFDTLYKEWRLEAYRASFERAERVRATGVTATEPVAGYGPYAAAPRVSPDGARLSFAAHDYRSDPATRLVDLATGGVHTLARRNQFGALLGPAAWLPDGTGLVVAQLEMRGPYRIFSDLWRVDLQGGEHRLTRGQRLAQPDVSPDGRRIAAIRSRHGALQLVIHDLGSGATRVLADATPGDAFGTPRWSPDGSRIAAARYAAGRVDVVVVDAASGRVTPVTRDDALDLSPAWSPDGEWLVWWSDRTGVPNLMAARPGTTARGAGAGTVYQATNLLTGGFDPEVSPDGRTLYLSVYHHDGWRIESTPFDPASWRPAPESVMRYAPGVLPEPKPAGSAEVGTASSSYSPWPTLRPYFWFPEWVTLGGAGGELSFLGLYTSGRDVLYRHGWELSLGADLGTGRVRGSAAWVYRGLGIADIHLFGGRRWSRVAELAVTDGVEAVYRLTDRVAAEALLWRARWRSRAWLRVAADAEWRELQGHDLTDAELRREGWLLVQPATVAGVAAGPGFSNARYHPFSISAEDGVAGSFAIGRWWDVTDGTRAYDEGVGRLAGYFAFPVWGFSNHVLAGRGAGLIRDGNAAVPRSIGGVHGATSGLPAGTGAYLSDGGTFLPVRGFDSGARAGTRAWAATGEWRFPIHLRDPTGGIMGFSLTSVSGALFADAGDAWCPFGPGDPADSASPGLARGCSPADAEPLLSAGAELSIDFGMLHNSRALLRIGVAQPIRGPGAGEPAFYVGVGPAF